MTHHLRNISPLTLDAVGGEVEPEMDVGNFSGEPLYTAKVKVVMGRS